MVRKHKRCISYVIPLDQELPGHRLGINKLTADLDRKILYSAGRDGLLCSWNIDGSNGGASPVHESDHAERASDAIARNALRQSSPPAPLGQTQIHTNWINDIALVKSGSAIVSASADTSIRLCRLHFAESHDPEVVTLGVHSDYAKVVASPSPECDWISSGGLDSRICLWDLNGGGKILQFDGQESPAVHYTGSASASSAAKRSIYALAARVNVIASGGPEGIVRLWDPRSGRRIRDLIGHTDNIKDILISENGDSLLSASSDQLVKAWSIAGGRCFSTYSMHNDSVWSLCSEQDSNLRTFYSCDRSGSIVKTETRARDGSGDSISIALAKEYHGITSIVKAGDYLWTATSSSSINRWSNAPLSDLWSMQLGREDHDDEIQSASENGDSSLNIQPRNILCITKTGRDGEGVWNGKQIGPGQYHSRQNSMHHTSLESEVGPGIPMQDLASCTIEGQNGLTRHVMLNNKRQVLTLDTTGEIVLWDLLRCRPLRWFGKRHLLDVHDELETAESVAHWCHVDTKTGLLAVTLDEDHCFDAEIYADELEPDIPSTVRQESRINLGRTVLLNLFYRLVELVIARDSDVRQKLSSGTQKADRDVQDAMTNGDKFATPLPTDTLDANPSPPNSCRDTLVGGLTRLNTNLKATSSQQTMMSPRGQEMSDKMSPVKRSLHASMISRLSTEQRSSSPSNSSPRTSTDSPINGSSVTPSTSTGPDMSTSTSPLNLENLAKSPSSSFFSRKLSKGFAKRTLRMSSSNGNKNIDKGEVDAAIQPEEVVVEEAVMNTEDSECDAPEDVDQNLRCLCEKIRSENVLKSEGAGDSPQGDEAYVIVPLQARNFQNFDLPKDTSIIIQEEREDFGGTADVFRVSVGALQDHVDKMEDLVPLWLAKFLLLNIVPTKEPAQITFSLVPYEDLLPRMSNPDGNTRLSANQTIRVKKILAHVAENLEAQAPEMQVTDLQPEEYLELYCQDILLDPDMTLATLRAHVWKAGGEITCKYRSNGKRIAIEQRPRKVASATSLHGYLDRAEGQNPG